MTRILVDTSAYSEHLRGHPEVKAAVQRASAIGLSVVSIGEPRAGFVKGERARRNEEFLRSFLASPRARALPVDEETAGRYAAIRDYLRRQGTPPCRPTTCGSPRRRPSTAYGSSPWMLTSSTSPRWSSTSSTRLDPSDRPVMPRSRGGCPPQAFAAAHMAGGILFQRADVPHSPGKRRPAAPATAIAQGTKD
jgi:predicted nucleic acid-binding protein